jgi:hypothetical protein
MPIAKFTSLLTVRELLPLSKSLDRMVEYIGLIDLV